MTVERGRLVAIRSRQMRLLIRPLLRAIPFAALVGAALVAFGLLYLTQRSVEASLVMALRTAAIALALGAAFVIDDPASATIAHSPATLLYRRALRLAMTVAAVATFWTALAWYAVHNIPSDGVGATVRGASLELGAMLAVTLVASSVAGRFLGDARGGIAGGPSLLAFLGAWEMLRPTRWSLFAGGPGDPVWSDAHARWAWVLAAATAVLVIESLDPARRRLRNGIRPRPVPPKGGMRRGGPRTTPHV